LGAEKPKIELERTVLSTENHAFEKLKNQRTRLVERDCELKTFKLF
jgi:hypothetical protein